jgi:hypothetical protein
MTELITHGRLAELADRLVAVRARVTAACEAASRDPRSVSLLAVTKTIPAADVALLLDLGLTAFGENRAQEAGAKVAEVARLRPDVGPRWHQIGSLQRRYGSARRSWGNAPAREAMNGDQPTRQCARSARSPIPRRATGRSLPRRRSWAMR